MRLIILEDNPTLTHSLCDILQTNGHTVELVTSNAREAVSFAERHKPDLLLADVDLGAGGNGIEAAVELREKTGLKTVFLTGCSGPETRDRSQQAWPCAFLRKPVVPDLLVRVLKGLAPELTQCSLPASLSSSPRSSSS